MKKPFLGYWANKVNCIAAAAENERRVSFSGEKPLKILITQRRGAVQPVDEPIKRVACRLFDDPPKGDENAARSVILLHDPLLFLPLLLLQAFILDPFGRSTFSGPLFLASLR
jgi:hypothetical protein